MSKKVGNAETKPHKWAEAIKAWADGKTVQYKYLDWNDREWKDNEMTLPRFDIGDLEWRVKPEPVETYHFVEYMGEGDVEMYSSENLKANLRLTFEDKKLVKAEVIG